jgi:hypothetical protein
MLRPSLARGGAAAGRWLFTLASVLAWSTTLAAQPVGRTGPDSARVSGPPAAPVSAAAPTATNRAVFHGYDLKTTIPSYRADEEIAVDGRLDEAVWSRAPMLTGFSQYVPVDERKAEDSTEVYLWYSASAIHFGIKAYARPGTLRATLADRDRIDGEDHIQILLDTDNAHRRAFVFAVNAYGVQADGMRIEGTQGNTPRPGLQNSDITPDFVYTSKGRLTDYGFEVEVRIPFKSIRYGSAAEQSWGINIVRQVQSTGVQETWYPVRRANASFLVQTGQLTGLHDLKRGLTLDVNPVVTSVINGAARARSDGTRWGYAQTPEVGANVRWGVTPNLTLNAAINPDFSQVEADVQQIPGDARFPIFFPERRPFFTDGIELFDLPNRLVYTRRIVAPAAASRLSGKIGKLDIAALSALDDPAYSLDPSRAAPLFTIARLRRDLGPQGWIGGVVTDRTDGAAFNRVGAVDTRWVFGKLLQWSSQVVGSTTRAGTPGATARQGGLLYSSFTRSGRTFGFRYEVRGVSPGFVTQSGFIPRSDYVETQAANRVAFLGRPGAFVQNWSMRARMFYTHLWDDAWRGAAPLETKYWLENQFQLRSGWRGNLQPIYETFAFDQRQYAQYFVARSGGDTVPFQVNRRQRTGGLIFELNTPQWSGLQISAGGYYGLDPDFFETATARRRDLNLTVDWRPRKQLRVEPRLSYNRFIRVRDGTVVNGGTIPRLKVEYQVNRWVFVRYIGQYDARLRDALRDPRTDAAFLTRSAAGRFTPVAARRNNDFRNDLLFSYQPNPGTTVFVGYGASLVDQEAFRFRDVQRTADGFFLKGSYLYRLK